MNKAIRRAFFFGLGMCLVLGLVFFYLRSTQGVEGEKGNQAVENSIDGLIGEVVEGTRINALAEQIWKKGNDDFILKAVTLQRPKLERMHKIWYPSALAITYDRCRLLDRLLEEGFLGEGGDLLWKETVENCRMNCARVLRERKIKPPSDLVLTLADSCKEIVDVVVSAGLDVNGADSSGLRPLHYLVVNGDFDLAKVFISKGAKVNSVEKGVPLLCSIISDEKAGVEAVRFLIDNGADVNYCLKEVCPIHCAIEVGRKDIVEILLASGARLFSPPPEGRSKFYAYHLAVVFGGAEMLDFLIERLSPADRRSLFGDLEFWQALSYPENQDVEQDLELLVKKYKFNPNGSLKMTWENEVTEVPVLSVLAYLGNETAVRTMLRLGSYAKVGREEVRPVKFAGIGRNVGVVKILIERGANPFYVDKHKRWNLYHLLVRSRDEDENRLVDVIHFLSQYKVDVNFRSRLGNTPLMAGIVLGKSLPVIRALVEVGADVNAVDYGGWSVLLYSLRYAKDPRIVTFLLVKGAKVPESTPEGRPLIELLKQNRNFSPVWYKYIRDWQNWGLILEGGEGHGNG